MSPSIALALYAVGIAGLFYLDRDAAGERPSKALWLPVIWLWIDGSRPVSAWLGMNPRVQVGGQLPETSLLDQSIAAGLMLLGFIVVSRRRREIRAVLKASWPIALYFSYALVSLLWSDYPAWGFKRWVRAIGEVVMVLIVATDAHPTAAFKRLFSRVGFVLLPLSLLFIKYFPGIGRGYDQWGQHMNMGVTTNKNTLGVVVFVIALGAAWQVLRLYRDRQQPHWNRHMLAQCVLLFFGVDLLVSAHSATSGVSFCLGAGLMMLVGMPRFRRNPATVHMLVFTILLCGSLTWIFGGTDVATQAVGRTSDFTGRTEIWKVLIPMAPNALLGAGFETFWIGPRVDRLDKIFGFINESHNGYIEIYLNLGLTGLCLVALLLLQGYRAAVAAIRRVPSLAALLIAYVLTAAFYSVTEAGFRMTIPIWFFLLLAVTAANRLAGRPVTADAVRPVEAALHPDALGSSSSPAWQFGAGRLRRS